MARNDVKIHDVGGLNNVPVIKCITESGATDILAGEPVKMKSAGSPYVVPLGDGDPEIGTDIVVGIAATDSTHTASADGEIYVYDAQANMGVIYKCKATTAANFDTQSEIDALVGDFVTFDFSSSTYTVDENEGNDGPHGLQVVGGDPSTKEVYFKIRYATTEGAVA